MCELIIFSWTIAKENQICFSLFSLLYSCLPTYRWSRYLTLTSFHLTYAQVHQNHSLVLLLYHHPSGNNGMNVPGRFFFDLYSVCRTYVGAPRALLGRQRSSSVLSNSTDNIPNGRLFGNIFECPNGTDQCRPIFIESN